MKKSDRIIVTSIILVLSLVLVGTAAAQTPAVRVTKDPATQTVRPGDPASFTFTLTNNGDVDLSPIAVLDYINGVKVPECSKNLTGLHPGESTSYTCSHGGEMVSYTNIVSAIAWSPTTETYTKWNDSAEVTVVPWNPAVRVTKDPATQTVRPGDPASFTFTLTNNGDVDLSPIAVLDYINGVKVPECSKNLTGLHPGESTSYTCSHGGEMVSYTNIVSAIAWSPTTETYTKWNDSAEVTVVPWNPAVRVTKDPATQTVRPGDPASFTFTLTNNGDVDLSPIAVLDYINGVKVPECSKNLTGLHPGESTSYTCSHGGEMVSYTNIVSAIAWSPTTETYTKWNDSAEVTVVPWNPAVRVTKDPATQTVRPGDPASFTFTLTNNGDVDLSPIAVLDYINGVKVPECSKNLTGLHPGESTSYTCSHGGEMVSYTNIVSAIAWSPTTETYTKWNDSAEVTVVPWNPAVRVTKDPATQTVRPGDPASFTFTLTNNGDVDLSPIAVLDYINGVKVPECSKNLTGLHPGESTSYTCSHGGEMVSYTNIVSAIAWSPTTETYTKWNDSAEVTVVPWNPAVRVTKDPATQTVRPGDPASFTFTLTNNGDVDLSPIAVLDYINGVKVPECSKNLTGLHPGESTSYTCSHGGEMVSYTNIVSAIAWSPTTETYTKWNDSAEVTVVPWNPVIVPVDIEPGICPNIIALNFKGPHLFVAIPGTENLDAKKIDPATITLSREGISEEVKPLSSTLVIIPYLVTTSCNCQNSVRDYTQDLVLVFDAGEVVTQLQLQDVTGETVPFTVQGMLKAEYGTTPITGSDCMKVLPEYSLNLFFVATCPVDLTITDPDGLEMSKISHEIPSAQYFEADINDDGSPDDVIFIGERKIGDYSVQVIPELNANPADTYSLTAGSGQSEVILADNVAIDNIPDNPYKIQVAQNGEITVPAKVRIVPKSLNIASKGKFVAFISLPNNYKAADVDAKSVECEGAPALRLIRIKAFPNKFAAVFNRDKLVNVKPGDKVKVTVTGTINKNGQNVGFLGSDVIKVTSKKGNIKEAIDDVEKMTDENVFNQFNPQ